MRHRSDAGGERRLAGLGRPERPSIARIFDSYLGGTSHFDVDERTAAEIEQVLPNMRAHVRELHGFLRRSVRYLAEEEGIAQFLDLGTGLPTVGDVHGMAQRVNPNARVVYVDANPLTVQLAEAQLAGTRGVTVVHADLCEPASVLTSPGVTSMLDFTRPVGVLAMAALPFIAEHSELVGVVAAYRDACSLGSALVASHLSPVAASPAQVEGFNRLAGRIGTTPVWRPPADFQDVFEGFELVKPGLVQTPEWRPDAGAPADSAEIDTLSAVGLVVDRKETGPLQLTL